MVFQNTIVFMLTRDVMPFNMKNAQLSLLKIK